MKILLLTYGTRGDVQPYVALGAGLRAAGHEVTLATSERFSGLAAEYGLGFHPMSDALLALLDTDAGRNVVENGRSVFDIFVRGLRVVRKAGALQQEQVDEGWEAARETAPDLILYHPKGFGAPHYGEKLGVPVMLSLLIPMMLETGDRPNPGFPALGLGRWYNRATYRLVNAMPAGFAGKPIRRWRKANGLDKARARILKTPGGAPVPVLNAFSRHTVPHANDWPDHVHTTGYWFLDAGAGWTPPPALAAFLEAGPPPVYVGFGSMAGRNPERLARAAIDGLARAGQRGILATGWGGLAVEDLPETVFKISEAPHDWLFPRMAAITHHGGAGTTAAALRSGRPQILVPFFGDQPFWAKQMEDLGVAAAPLAPKRFGAETFETAVRTVCERPAIARKAEEIAALIRAENGVAEAVALIERYAAR